METTSKNVTRYPIELTEEMITRIENGGYILIPFAPNVYIPFDSRSLLFIDEVQETFDDIEDACNQFVVNPTKLADKMCNKILRLMVKIYLKLYTYTCIKGSTRKAIKELSRNASGEEYRDVTGRKIKVIKSTVLM